VLQSESPLKLFVYLQPEQKQERALDRTVMKWQRVTRELGLGTKALSKIVLLGCNISDIKMPFVKNLSGFGNAESIPMTVAPFVELLRENSEPS